MNCPLRCLLGQNPLCMTPTQSLMLLLFRVVMGAAFICHGWPKIQHAFTWMDGMGLAVPGIIQALAALAEVGGGVAIVLGWLTSWAGLAIAGTMVGALLMVHFPAGHPFVSMGTPSYEPALFYLVSALWLTVSGPGAYSMDARCPSSNACSV
ncbi:MAG: DoxX family protein [Vampirovibrionales bacterium]